MMKVVAVGKSEGGMLKATMYHPNKRFLESSTTETHLLIYLYDISGVFFCREGLVKYDT